METIIFIMSSIILAVVLLFFIALYIGATLSKAKSKRKLHAIYEASPYREKASKKPQKPSDEFQARDERKEIVTGKAVSQAYQKNIEKHERYQEGLVPLQKNKNVDLKENTTIVDIAKPVGFWSRLIMSQKLGFLMNLRNEMGQNKHGYFVNLIRAQARSQSKEKSRGVDR